MAVWKVLPATALALRLTPRDMSVVAWAPSVAAETCTGTMEVVVTTLPVASRFQPITLEPSLATR